ncbi:MAG: MFS transporter [Pseudomonadota bacterium]|nr:MFS transporter [Pseudomonadota bacterium]
MSSPSSLGAQLRAFDYVFWLCIFMELMERMAYYGVRLVVPVFVVLAPSEGGAGLTHTEKGTMLACWAATQSWLPTFAGGFADRFGYKRTIAVSVVFKAVGYAVMAMATGFWSMLLGTQLLATGTGIFKPGIQGTLAHSIARSKGSASMGWGLFYQSVNVGAAVAAFIPAFARDTMGWGWHGVFATCSLLVLSNLLPLSFYTDPTDERGAEVDTRGPLVLVRESIVELFTSPVLLGFIFISAGFWFGFHQLFDMLPNYVDDWTDSSGLLASLGQLVGNEAWIAEGAQGVNIPQERLININAFLIMGTMFLFAWLSSRVSTLTSTILGMGIASLSLIAFVYTANVYVVLAGVAAFTVGEMLASPKKMEYLASLAPPGKRALYLGYANMPDGIGWVLGSLVAGASYEERADKINLCRKLLAGPVASEPGAADAAAAWLARARSGGVSDAALTELARSIDAPTAEQALATFAGLNGPALVSRLAEHLPRGEVLDFALAAMPTLPNGEVATATSLRALLYATYQPGEVWWTFVAIGVVSTIGMIGYDRWVRGRAVEARKAA